MHPLRLLYCLFWPLLVVSVTICSASSSQYLLAGDACDASHLCNATIPLYVQDDFLGDDSALADSLIQYLDTHEPTNPLGVLMIPAPASLFEKFKATLASLGAASSNSGKFPQLQTAAFSRGSGVFPGKVATTASKDCHSDYEVDSDFNVENVLGPTTGRVGILYLSGEGDFLLVDKATGEETREEIKPGRFISWSNNGQQHCVATSSAQPPRRFLGPVVLGAGHDSLIPVVDILVTPGPKTCSSAAKDCTTSPNVACVDGLCCTPAGSAFSDKSFCCSGAARWSATGTCCYLIGMSASAANQCCSRRLVGYTCAPALESGCLPKCKKDALEHWKFTKSRCRSTACEEMAAASQYLHMAWCYAARLPRKC